MIKVVIADDQALVRGGFRLILEAQDDIEVVGEANDGTEAIELTLTTEPHVVLMDIRMPEMDGIEATRRLVNDGRTNARVLILTTFDLDEHVYNAIQAGASGFLLKDVPPAQLTSAIRVVSEGEMLVSPAITRRLLERFVSRPAPGQTVVPRLETLTEREVEVLKLIARGLSNQEIAGSLYLSETTVKTHVSRILSKMGLRDRVQAVVLAYESGLVEPRM